MKNATILGLLALTTALTLPLLAQAREPIGQPSQYRMDTGQDGSDNYNSRKGGIDSAGTGRHGVSLQNEPARKGGVDTSNDQRKGGVDAANNDRKGGVDAKDEDKSRKGGADSKDEDKTRKGGDVGSNGRKGFDFNPATGH